MSLKEVRRASWSLPC